MTDTDLSPETVLQLAPGIRTRLDAGGHVVLDAPVGTVVDIGPNGFAILSLFSQPRTLGGAIERLEREGGGSTPMPVLITARACARRRDRSTALITG